jgi:hypothetical protein
MCYLLHSSCTFYNLSFLKRIGPSTFLYILYCIRHEENRTEQAFLCAPVAFYTTQTLRSKAVVKWFELELRIPDPARSNLDLNTRFPWVKTCSWTLHRLGPILYTLRIKMGRSLTTNGRSCSKHKTERHWWRICSGRKGNCVMSLRSTIIWQRHISKLNTAVPLQQYLTLHNALSWHGETDKEIQSTTQLLRESVRNELRLVKITGYTETSP